MIPTATLKGEYHLNNPPRLIGAHIQVSDKTVAVISLDALMEFIEDSRIAEAIRREARDWR